MKAQLTVFAMTAILIVGIGTAPAFGQILGAVSVSTDKETYQTGDTIVVSGTIRDNYGGAIGITITAPNGNIVYLAQSTPTADKTYQTETVIGGVFKFSGTYTVEVTYGSEDRVAATTFNVDVVKMQDTMEPEPTPVETPPVYMIDDVEDGIQYSITGGTLKSIVPMPESNSLIVMIEATEDGTLTMTIPKTILKAEENGLDTGVFILIDDGEANFEESITEVDRTITLEFSAGAEKIEIIGTWVIPEFGVIAAMILAVAIISIIAISAKSKLSIIPRY